MKKLLLIMLGVANCAFAQYRPSVFQGSTMNFKPRDYSILQRGLDRAEKRMNEASEQYLKLCRLLGEYEMQLHNDTDTRTWFSNYKKEIIKKYDSLIEDNRWGEAGRYAVREIGRIATDSELMARIRTAREYDAIVASIQERTDMNQDEKHNWIIDHPYCFIPVTNSSGDIIDGRLGTKEEFIEYKKKNGLMAGQGEANQY